MQQPQILQPQMQQALQQIGHLNDASFLALLQSVPNLIPQPGTEVAMAVKVAAVGAASSVPVPLNNMAALTQQGGGKGSKGLLARSLAED